MNLTCPSPVCWSWLETSWLEDDGSFVCNHCGETLTADAFKAFVAEIIKDHEKEIERLKSLLSGEYEVGSGNSLLAK